MPVTITGFQPQTGVEETLVTITGTGFTNGDTRVFFNGMEAQATVISTTSITASVPASASTGPIRVANPNGAATSDQDFTVEFFILNFFPRQGPRRSQVRIGGQGFIGTTGVRFNGIPAMPFQVQPSGIMILATVPPTATTGAITLVKGGVTARSNGSFIVTDEFIRHERLAASAANPFESAMIAAWNALFQAGPNNLPDYIQNTYSTLSVPDVTGTTLPPEVDVCLVLDDPDSPIGKDSASLDLTAMSFSGIANIGQNGPPVFSNNDAQVMLPTQLSTIAIAGTFNVSQTCCIPSIIGCLGDSPGSAGGGFTYTIPSMLMDIAVNLTTNPASGQPVVHVTGLTFTVNSSPSVNIPSSLPSWLSWVNYLTAYIVTATMLKSTLSTNVASAIQSTALASQIETILNQVLGTSTHVAPTRARA